MKNKKDTIISSRKAEHIQINLENDVKSSLKTGLDDIQFIHQALPEINLENIVLDQKLFGKVLSSPILISSMTGGTPEASRINKRLASVAQEMNIAMGVGSQRAAIEDPKLRESFQIRDVAPNILLFANLGAIQLNYGYTLDSCKRAIEMIEADALILHLNPLQEALQPEGNTQFKGLLHKIEHICTHINSPVIVKEVGWGISAETAQRLQDAGVSAIDVAGAGGTSWSQVEMFRNKDPFMAEICGDFRNWGINTVDSINNVRRFAPEMIIFASGGLKNGIDICKTLALGAKLGGMASIFLKAATSEDESILLKTIQKVSQEISICLFVSGIKCLSDINSSILKQ